MLTPKQTNIFSGFLRKPYKEFTYKELKKLAEQKSNSVVQNAIRQFLAENLITKKEIGNSNLYAANLNNSATLAYLLIHNNNSLSSLAKKSLEIIKEELITPFTTIAIFGSYAEATQTETSDLDVVIIVNTLEDKKTSEQAMKNAERKSILQIDTYVFTKKEFLDMLKDKKENLGKQIAHKHLTIQNPEIFYTILKEGINNGFKIIY